MESTCDHEYYPHFTKCSNCDRGYIICENCEGDGSCLEVCDKGVVQCPKKGCKYGYIYQSHYCIKCPKTKYVK